METAPRQIQQAELLAHMGWVRGLARSLVVDDSLADDIAQEAWLAAHRAPPARVESDGQLRAWLATVVRNLARRSARAAARRRGREVEAARTEATESTADLVARGAMHRDLTNCLMALDEPHRSTLLLRYLDSLSTAEVADRQGVSPAAARKRLSRATEKLRASLDDAFDGDRQAWTMALMPLTRIGTTAKVAAGTTTWAHLGILAMNTKFALALVVAALAVVFALSQKTGPESDGRETARVEAGDQASVEPLPMDVPAEEDPVRTPAAAASQRLTVLDAEGAPLTDALVMALVDGALRGSTRTDGAGETDLKQQEGALEVLVAPRGRAPQRFMVGPAYGVSTLRLGDGLTVSGEIVGVEAPETLDLVLSFDRPMTAVAGLDAEALDLLVQEGIGPDELTVRPDGAGRFRFAGLAANWSGALRAPEGTRIVEGASMGPSMGPSMGAVFEGRELLLLDPAEGLVLPLERLLVLHGRVVDRAGGSPVPGLRLGVRVEVDRRSAGVVPQVVTDPDGSFRLDLPLKLGSPVPWRLELTALEPVALSAPWSFASGDLAATGALGDLEIDLGDPLTFRVQTTEGEPIQGAVGTLAEPATNSTPTDASGRASIRGMRGERATLVVVARGFSVAEVTVTRGLEQVVTLQASRALQIEVQRPDGEGADDLMVQILGEERVWQAPGPPGWMDLEVLEPEAVRLREILEQPRALDGGGRLEVGPLRGGVRLEVVLLDPSGERLESRTVVTPRAPGLSEVAFVAPNVGFRVAGQVRTPDGRPLPRASVHVEASGVGTQTMTDADGRFSIGPFHAPVTVAYLEIARPGFAVFQQRDVRFDELSAPLAVVLEPARRVEVELVDGLGRPVDVSYLEARLASGASGAALRGDDGLYVFRALPFVAGEVVVELAGVEIGAPIDAVQTRLTMRVPAMGSVEVGVAPGTEFADRARVNVTWRRIADGVVQGEARQYFRRSGGGFTPLKLDLPPGSYELQLEQRVLSRRLVETLGEPTTIDVVAGELRSLVLP